MKKLCSLILLLAFTVACNKTGDTSACSTTTTPSLDGTTDTSNCSTDGPPSTPPIVVEDGDDSIPDDDTDSLPVDDENGIPTAASTFETNITLVNLTSTQAAKYEKAIEIVKQVVATEEFRNRVLNHTYNGSKTYVDNAGFTNAQIYQKILDGAESLQPAKNNRMDLEVEMYTNNLTSTVGYTYSNSKRIWVNTKFFNSYNAAGVAHNLFHEWLHKLGFSHASSYSVSRDYSVPYAIGDIIGELGKKFL